MISILRTRIKGRRGVVDVVVVDVAADVVADAVADEVHQVVAAVVVEVAAGAGAVGVAVVVEEEVAEEGGVEEEQSKWSLKSTDTRVSSLPKKAKKICWSQRVWFREKLCTEKRRFL